MNTKLHALADANGRPLSFFMTAGQVSDYSPLLDPIAQARDGADLAGRHRSPTLASRLGLWQASQNSSF